MKIIIYDEKLLQAFEVAPINFEMKDEAPYLECTILDCWQKGTIRGIDKYNYKLALETDAVKKIAELDPTLMKRIAKYNLERENEVLTKEIDFKQAKLRQMQEKIEREQQRLDNLRSVIADFIEGDYETVSDMFSDEGEEW